MLTDALLAQYERETQLHSFDHMFRSQPTFAEIVALGDKAVPRLLQVVQEGKSGRNIHLLLETITGERPYTAVIHGPFALTDISRERFAWQGWGMCNGHLQTETV